MTWLFILFAIATAIVLLLYSYFNPSRPAIAAHMPRGAIQAEKEFDRRIKARFPLGSSAAEMERVLFEDGFGPAKPFEHSRYVRLDRPTGFLLEEGFTVVWEANDDKLTRVVGSYGLTGP